MSTLLVKLCGRCRIEKPLIEFHKHKGRKFGVKWDCKECRKTYAKKFYKENKLKIDEKNRRNAIRYRYGITETKYDERMETSNSCQICGSTEELCYDHDHETMEFRGVLCRGCNRSIGQLGDTEESLLKAYNYLKRR